MVRGEGRRLAGQIMWGLKVVVKSVDFSPEIWGPSRSQQEINKSDL